MLQSLSNGVPADSTAASRQLYDRTSAPHPLPPDDGPPTVRAAGPDLAVAWWPELMHLQQDSQGTQHLGFQSIIGNLGNVRVPIAAGDYVEYGVYHSRNGGDQGALVGHGSAPLNRLDVQGFPPPIGEQLGHPAQSFGTVLRPVNSLRGRTVGIIGTNQPSQSIALSDASAGHYILRQRIVRAHPTLDVSAYDDIRDTSFVLDGKGHLLQTSSHYAGTAAAIGSATLPRTTQSAQFANALTVLSAAAATTGTATPAAAGPDRTVLPNGEQIIPSDVHVDGKRIYFDSMVGNTGQAPLEMTLHVDSHGNTSHARQVLFNLDGSKREVPIRGGFTTDARGDHNHLHFNDFVYFQFYKAAPGRGVVKPVGAELQAGVKQSFFITDVQEVNGTPKVNRRVANRLRLKGMVDYKGLSADSNVTQGISVGWADVYGSDLDGQNLKVGTLAPGDYILRQTFDPRDELREGNERDNSRDTKIHVDRQHNATIVGSRLVAADAYRRTSDGRLIVPSVVNSMVHVHRPRVQNGFPTG